MLIMECHRSFYGFVQSADIDQMLVFAEHLLHGGQ